jgi:predicted porin
MKKLIASFAVVPALSAGVAHAQSSVTLYGVIDTALVYANNSGGKSLYAAAKILARASKRYSCWKMASPRTRGAFSKAAMNSAARPMSGCRPTARVP